MMADTTSKKVDNVVDDNSTKILDTNLQEALKDWTDLSNEYGDLELLHKQYKIKLEEALSLQKKCRAGVNHQRYRLNAIKTLMGDVKTKTEAEKGEMEDLRKDIIRRKAQLNQMEDMLPKESGLYLKIILGNVNVSILDKQSKYDYKDQYETFKLIVTLIGCILAVVNLYFNNRVLDLIFMFLIVWYYCTLTIRESILKVNGSKIKGWWRAHHFLSTIMGGVLLVWPDGECYKNFRSQLMYFSVYLAFLQYLQFTYQRGCLYRLRSLGERNVMDITVDGFHSWMWKGMGFLLPFLYLGYIYELYNSYALYHLSFSESATWHVRMLSFLFFILGTGNFVTTSYTIPLKIRDRELFKLRFTRLDKYFWSHRRRRDSVSQKNKEYLNVVEQIISRRSPKISESIADEESDSSVDNDNKKRN